MPAFQYSDGSWHFQGTQNDALAEAMLVCCCPGSGSGFGSGSGSGGGVITDYGCGCNWAALGLTHLVCSVTLTCTGETLTFNLTGTITADCVVWSGTGTSGSGLNVGSYIDCTSGLGGSISQAIKTTISVEIACRKCTGSTNCFTDPTVWDMFISFSTVSGGLGYSGNTTPLPYTTRIVLNNCTPVLFNEKRVNFICQPTAPPDPRTFYNCCGTGAGDSFGNPTHSGMCTDTGYTVTDNAVGCVAIINISG